MQQRMVIVKDDKQEPFAMADQDFIPNLEIGVVNKYHLEKLYDIIGDDDFFT
jgi:hypothetical protein